MLHVQHRKMTDLDSVDGSRHRRAAEPSDRTREQMRPESFGEDGREIGDQSTERVSDDHPTK